MDDYPRAGSKATDTVKLVQGESSHEGVELEFSLPKCITVHVYIHHA